MWDQLLAKYVHICAYVCIYVYMCIYVYICMYMYIHISLSLSLRRIHVAPNHSLRAGACGVAGFRAQPLLYTCLYTYAYTYIYIYIYLHLCHVHLYNNVLVHLFACLFVFLVISWSIHLCLSVPLPIYLHA